MKTCLILCALVGAIHAFHFPNPFASKKKNESVGESLPKKISQVCFENYTELGCFANNGPWFTYIRPFPLPKSPKVIDTKIYLLTRNESDQRFTVKLWENISINGSDFDSERSHTVFITHGFSSNGNVLWVKQLALAYLARRDANIFIVDWGEGATNWNYFQVAANTRVVGAELKRFVKYLIEVWHLDPARIHFLGHSLGAHISAYAAKAFPGVAHLTAFDPAEPGFEGSAEEVRLAKNDAKFVDVIHTNIRPVLPFLGFGLMLPAGHVDYYMNGGALQPSCIVPPIEDLNITDIDNFNEIPNDYDQLYLSVVMYVKLASVWVACSHGKSYQYYIEALQNNNCTFWGRSTGVFYTLLDILTFGRISSNLEDYEDCTLETCSPIGLDAEKYPARGSFSVGTREESPYCQDSTKTTELMTRILQERLEGREVEDVSEEEAIFDKLKDIFKRYI